MASSPLRLGIAGYGGAARQILPAVSKASGVELTAVADLRYDTLAPFRARGIKTFDSAEAMFESPDVDAVWIATPNDLHMDHTVRAADNGKHIIGEKPMALTIEQGLVMIEAIERNRVKYVQGHSQMYNPPEQKMLEVIASGRLGRVFAINSWSFQNWLNEPRLASELDPAKGGGVAYRQGPHQTDIVRSMGGGQVKSVRAVTGCWNPHFPDTVGNYTAFLEFENGIAATMVLSGYDYFDSFELTEGEESARRVRRRERRTRPLEWEEKYALPRYAGVDGERTRRRPPYYSLMVVSCERGDLRPSSGGICVYDDEGRHEMACEERGIAHVHEVDELCASVEQDRPAFPDARWGLATLEVITAIMTSSAEHREITLQHQVPYRGEVP